MNSEGSGGGVTSVVTPIKSVEDEREYRYVQLSNQLGALLISDVETDKAACAMDVNVGSFADPVELPGLAHFCEHMLFLGTKKYPDENSYSAFLRSHGGMSNAFTDKDNTNFFFDVMHPHLEEALDRFAQFFIDPLFTESATDREIDAVDSENAKNLQDDDWKMFQLLKSFANPAHPYSHFPTGNAVTLRDRPAKNGINVREALLAFHEKHYSANVMKLCVIGRESLDVLQQWVVEKFAPIRNTNRPLPTIVEQPYTPEHGMGTMVRVVPVKDARELKVSWLADPTVDTYREKPNRLLAHLLGHEGKGSLLALLKAKSWGNELYASVSESQRYFSLFSVGIELAPDGMDHVPEILELVFKYLAMLRTTTDEKWYEIFEEMRDLSAMNFRFKGKAQPIQYTCGLASSMQVLPPEQILAGQALITEFDVELVRKWLNRLTPETAMISVSSKSFEGHTDSEEEWYKTPYSMNALDADLLRRLVNASDMVEPALHVPSPNEFIASDFSIRVNDEDDKQHEVVAEDASGDVDTPPTKVYASDGVWLWHKLDRRFKKPKAKVLCKIVSSVAHSSPYHSCLTEMFVQMLSDALTEISYPSEVAGLHSSVSTVPSGIQLIVSGYNHKLSVLFRRVVEYMMTMEFKRERFAVLRENLVRMFRNFDMEQPYQHAMYNQNVFLEDKKWHVHDKIAALESIRVEDVAAHRQRFFDETFVECLTMGNMNSTEAIHLITDDVEEMLVRHSLHPSLRGHERLVQLESGHEYLSKFDVLNPNDVNSCVHNYYQVGESTVESAVYTLMVAHLVNEPCFNQLRTLEQLGYIVFSGSMVQRDVDGLRILVQSSTSSASYLDERVESFLNTFHDYLVEMSDEVFETNREAVISKLLQKDNNLAEEVSRWWVQINSRRYMFDRRQLYEAAYKAITKQQLIEFYEKHFMPNSKLRRKFSSQVFGKQVDTNVTTTMDTQNAHDNMVMVVDNDDDNHPNGERRVELVPPPENELPTRVLKADDYAKFRQSMPLFPKFTKF